MGKRIGDVAMTDAERQQRRRDKAKALRDAAAIQPACTAPAVPDLLSLAAEPIATRIYASVPVDKARSIAAAPQRRMWQGGSWPSWLPPIIS